MASWTVTDRRSAARSSVRQSYRVLPIRKMPDTTQAPNGVSEEHPLGPPYRPIRSEMTVSQAMSKSYRGVSIKSYRPDTSSTAC